MIQKASQREPFDASRFNDPVAEKTEWTPLKGGGSNFYTHKISTDSTGIIKFKPTIGAIIFYLIFILVGIGIPVGILIGSSQSGESMAISETLFIILFGLVFFGAGSLLLYFSSKPIVFDKLMGMYWKSWKKPDPSLIYSAHKSKDAIRLSDIRGLQLISEYIRSDKSSYHSYELNLVLMDGSRVNVVDHGNAVKLRNDAKILSEFLGKPVWDAI
ncbi:MAG: hypothetical protein WD735_01100 [Balneolaceae bacterium]